MTGRRTENGYGGTILMPAEVFGRPGGVGGEEATAIWSRTVFDQRNDGSNLTRGGVDMVLPRSAHVPPLAGRIPE